MQLLKLTQHHQECIISGPSRFKPIAISSLSTAIPSPLPAESNSVLPVLPLQRRKQGLALLVLCRHTTNVQRVSQVVDERRPGCDNRCLAIGAVYLYAGHTGPDGGPSDKKGLTVVTEIDDG